MNLKIVMNDDAETVAEIREGLKRTGGYCPCLIEKTPDTKCMCRAFREKTDEGECHCGLYRKVRAD